MKISKELKAGLVVTAAIALFIFGFNFLKGRNIFTPQRVFYAIYDNVDGLLVSNPVQINGFKIGQVIDYKLLPDNSGKILVAFSVNDKNFKIPANTVAKIVSSDFLGAKAIELRLGDSEIYLDNKDTLRSAIQASLTEEVNRQVLPLKNKAESLISSIDSVMTVVQAILNEDARADLKKSFESINRAIINMEKTSFRIDALVADEKARISSIFRNIESISGNLAANNQTLTKVINNFEAISDSLAKSNLASTINTAGQSLIQASEILEKINKGEGSMGLLLNNKSLYQNLEKASLDLDKLLKDMRMNPARYLHFSIIDRKEKTKQEE